MVDSRPSSTDEKATVVDEPKRRSFFSRKKTASPADLKDEKQIPAISFTELFRYSTPFEIFIDCIGIAAACAAGAAQPLMSLLFGNLTQAFVDFTQIVSDPKRQGEIPQAASDFRHSAGKSASYLVIIGVAFNAKRIRERYLQAVLRQDIAFFDNVGAGEVATRIQTDTHLVQQGISEKVALVANFLAAFVTVMNKFISSYMQLSLKHTAEGGSLAEEVISTIRTAQAFGTQTILGRLYNDRIDESLKVDMKAATWHGGGLAVFFFVIYSAYALAFSFGTTLINEGHATPGRVVNVFLAILIGSFSLALLAPEMQAVTHGRGAAAKLYHTIDRVPDIDSANPDGLKPEKVEGELKLENVVFAYPSRPTVQVVKGLDITFRAGKTAALVGASGSGKSTIISLVERFYDPLSGAVKLDGRNLKDLNLKWLRTQHEHASEEEKDALIKEACIKANADGFITKLPLGYDTMVGERGFLLSGGQKQRVAIARAIVSDPRILLLDEATSALDTQSEGIVQDALDKAAAGRTTITIAHRLSTIKDADVIYVMGDGLVLEYGNHNELLQRDGAYARLVRRRSSGKARSAARRCVGRRLGRRRGPVARSEILAQRRKAAEESGEKEVDYSMPYLFKRMAPLIRDQWKNYILVLSLRHDWNGASDRRHQGDRNALWMFIIAILHDAIGCQNYLFSVAAAKLTSRLRNLSFKAILRQDIEFFDKDSNSTGALTSQLSDNPQKVNGLAGITLGAIVQSIATLITGSILVLFSSGRSLLLASLAPLLVSTGYIRLRVVVLKDQANKKAHEDSAQLACEAAGSIRTVAALTREEDCLRLYSESLEEPLRKSNRTAIWSNMLYSFSQSLVFFVIALIFWFGATLVSKQEATTFEFFVGLMVREHDVRRIQAGNVFSFVPDISSAKGAGSDIIKLLDSRPEIDAESTEGKVLAEKAVQGHIRFENVHFRYPTRPGVRVLRDLSFEVQPGTYIALVGASGSGKSTTIQLIERFYDPLAGEVYLDGERITDLNIQEYRKHLALVSQEPTLYAGTVRFNILLGAIKPHSEVTQEEIEDACRNANILEFIESLPQGFDTEVGGKGSQLSGGQKQRIAIARALLRNPKVLLLDEATSALDSNSEKVVQAALDQAAKGRTTIAIAHRLSTIQNADRIYFIKEGRVSESGTHDELLEKRGDYYEFVQLQALSKRE
ncbi:P-loop containing nucleoside triphosphate hydrolase protein [Pholiota molesta]|nr:P-loop containing nucleoside triphosphate hydrolase protein [Pholiota molesta]